LCSACGSPQDAVPFATPSLDRASVAVSQDLLYVSDLGKNAVDIFSYPAGKPAGKLTGFGSVAGLCADKTGNVFVVDEAGPVVMYAHGATSPIRKLGTSGAPYGCAVDPVTGNLAVTNLSSYLYGTIAVYSKAKGAPHVYKDTAVDLTYACSYDGGGNLFIDGWNRYGTPILLRLAKGGKTFRTFVLGKSVKKLAGVQWDGKYVVVGDLGAGQIYRFDTSGKIRQTIKLKGGADVDLFWLAGSTLVGPNDQVGGTVPFWHYPAGGSPVKTLSSLSEPIAVAISPAKMNSP
jgi:DNA-binding beta-propeller fold protein YncE